MHLSVQIFWTLDYTLLIYTSLYFLLPGLFGTVFVYWQLRCAIALTV